MSDDRSRWARLVPYLPMIIRNVAAFSGLTMVGVGLWWYEPWVSMTVVGGILFGGVWWNMNRPLPRVHNEDDR